METSPPFIRWGNIVNKTYEHSNKSIFACAPMTASIRESLRTELSVAESVMDPSNIEGMPSSEFISIADFSVRNVDDGIGKGTKAETAQKGTPAFLATAPSQTFLCNEYLRAHCCWTPGLRRVARGAAAPGLSVPPGDRQSDAHADLFAVCDERVNRSACRETKHRI